jgi:hypothetical protein
MHLCAKFCNSTLKFRIFAMFITTDKQINNFYNFDYVYIYVKYVFMVYLDTTARLLSTSN